MPVQKLFGLPWALPLLAIGCTLDRTGAATNPSADAGAEDSQVADVSAEGGDAWQPDVTTDTSADSDETESSVDADLDAQGDGEACVPESDQELCASVGANCGTRTMEDNCGATRDVGCGFCVPPDGCGANVCTCTWSSRLMLEVFAATATPAGYSVFVTFDHAAWVEAGLSLANGRDVRVVRETGTTRVQLSRVVDPESGFNRADTTLWFPLHAGIAAGSTDTSYAIYFDHPNPGWPPSNPDNVFRFADFFNRDNSTDIGNGWDVDESNNTDVRILDRHLDFTVPADAPNRPSVSRAFNGLGDRLEWRFGFDWVRSGSEGNYRVHMQLGQTSAMQDPPPTAGYPLDGIGPSLVWAGPHDAMADHQGFGVISPAGTVSQADIVSGRKAIRVVANMTEMKFDLHVGGQLVRSDAEFVQSITTIDRVRFLTSSIHASNITPRRFGYVILRPLVEPEPVVTLGAQEDDLCL
jgi:hypothetical protein